MSRHGPAASAEVIATANPDSSEAPEAHEIHIAREFSTHTLDENGPQVTISVAGEHYTEVALNWGDRALPDLQITRVDRQYRRPRGVSFVAGTGGLRALIAALTALADAVDADRGAA